MLYYNDTYAKGSTKLLPAHWEGVARATLNRIGGEKVFGLPRGRGGRGVQGGNFAAPERLGALPRFARQSVSLKMGSCIFKQRAHKFLLEQKFIPNYKLLSQIDVRLAGFSPLTNWCAFI